MDNNKQKGEKKVNISFFIDKNGTRLVADASREEVCKCTDVLVDLLYEHDTESYLDIVGNSLLRLYKEKGANVYGGFLAALADITEDIDKEQEQSK